MSVRTRYSGSTRSWKYNERCHRVKRQICGNIKKAFFLKLPYSKVRASFTHLGRGGHLWLMPTPRAMFRILSVTCLLTRKALRLIIIPD